MKLASYFNAGCGLPCVAGRIARVKYHILAPESRAQLAVLSANRLLPIPLTAPRLKLRLSQTIPPATQARQGFFSAFAFENNRLPISTKNIVKKLPTELKM